MTSTCSYRLPKTALRASTLSVRKGNPILKGNEAKDRDLKLELYLYIHHFETTQISNTTIDTEELCARAR